MNDSTINPFPCHVGNMHKINTPLISKSKIHFILKFKMRNDKMQFLYIILQNIN